MYRIDVHAAATREQLKRRHIFDAVGEDFDVEPALFAQRGNAHLARAAAAWLSRLLTSAAIRELAEPLGLGRSDSVSNLTRRTDRELKKSSKLKRGLAKIESRLANESKKQGPTPMIRQANSTTFPNAVQPFVLVLRRSLYSYWTLSGVGDAKRSATGG